MGPPTNSISSAQHGSATLAPVIFHLSLGGEIDAWSRRGLQFRCPACDSARFIHFWCISRFLALRLSSRQREEPSFCFHPVVAVEQSRPAWSHERDWIRCTCTNSVRLAGCSRSERSRVPSAVPLLRAAQVSSPLQNLAAVRMVAPMIPDSVRCLQFCSTGHLCEREREREEGLAQEQLEQERSYSSSRSQV